MRFKSNRFYPFYFLILISHAPACFAQETLALDEITVTAQYRDQRHTLLPTSVDVVDDLAIEQLRVNRLDALSALSSNAAVVQTTAYKNIFIRGVGGGGRNAGFDTRVGIYLDGVYMGQAMAIDNPVFDIEQIEVLKGPQGYLFGNNSDAGAINLTSKKPTHEKELLFSAGLGNFGYHENTITLNGEISPALTGRLIVRNEDHNGFVTNTFNNEKLKYQWRFATRGQLKLEATEQLDILLAADYVSSHRDTFLYQPNSGLFDQPLADNATAFDRVNVNQTPYSRIEGYGLSLTTDYYFANDDKFTTIIAARDWRNDWLNDNDYSDVDLISTHYQDQTRQYSQELRYTSAEDIDWPFVVGLYFSQETTQNDRLAAFGQDVDTLIALKGLPEMLPFNAVFGIQPNAQTPLFGEVKNNVKALYSNIDHSLNDHLVMHAGARYSIEEKHLTFSIDGTQSGTIDIATLDNEKRSIKQTFFSPMLGLSYHLNDHSNLYGKVSRAYKSGGWNVDFLTAGQVNDGFEYDSESVVAYEMGYKYATKRLRLSMAAFVNCYKDYQVFQLADLGGITQVLQLRNAASVKAQGLEFNLKHLFNNQWDIDARLGYLDATYQRFRNGGVDGTDATGLSLPNAPKWSGAVTINHRVDWSMLNAPISFSLQSSFQSSSHSGVSNDPQVVAISGRAVFNAFAQFESADKHWAFSLWVKNLANKEYATAKGRDFFGNQAWVYALPRMYGVNGSYRF